MIKYDSRDSFIEPTSDSNRGGGAMSACCELLMREKLQLQKALEKERQRRRRITMAFNKLLQVYHCVIDLNDFLNLSSISSDVDEEKIRRLSSSSSGSGMDKENQCDTPTFPLPKMPPSSVPTVKSSDTPSNRTNQKDVNANRATLPSRRIPSTFAAHLASTVNVLNDTNSSTLKKPSIFKSQARLISNQPAEQTSSAMPGRVEATETRPTSTVNLVGPSVNRAMTAESLTTTKERRPSIEVIETEVAKSNPSRSENFLERLRAANCFADSVQSTLAIAQKEPTALAGDKANVRETSSNRPTTDYHHSHVPQRSSEWYFVPVAGKDGKLNKMPRNYEGLERWLRNSDQRQRQIAEASQRRAEIAAVRRTTMVDLLCCRRVLDEDAMRILQNDSSTISSFPPNVMRQMRSESRKKYLEYQARHGRGMSDPREKLLQMATNKLMARASATITKSISKRGNL